MKTRISLAQCREIIERDHLNNDEIFDLIAKRLEPRFELNDNNREFYTQLKYYFNHDTRYTQDLKRGLLIVGGFGTGKTLALQIFYIYNFLIKNGKTMALYDTDEIIDSFCRDGRPTIDRYNPEYGIMIDELGQDTGRHFYFGTIEDPVDVLLGRRYRRFKDRGILTHAATNLDARGLQERFSEKIYDRLCETFNLIPIVGQSWRRSK